MTLRQEKILGAVIRKYVQLAEPISSGYLYDNCDLDVSPATIRAEMLELGKRGFLVKPHTSAGRIPSGKAYRYFVDNLLKIRKNLITSKEKSYIRSVVVRSNRNPYKLARNIGEAAAKISSSLALSGILETGEFFKVGFTRLFEMPEFHNYDTVFRVSFIFDEFERRIEEIGRFAENGPSVLIGRENPFSRNFQETIIITGYPLPGGHKGISAILGPLRMRYDKNIALMEYIGYFMKNVNYF